MQDSLPDDQKPMGEAFMAMLRCVEPVEPDVLLASGDVLDICGGCRVVGTPGHTPGHISLYLPAHGTVITGDAMVLENSLPAVANPVFAYSLPDAQRSLKRLLALDAETYICCHGGVYRR